MLRRIPLALAALTAAAPVWSGEAPKKEACVASTNSEYLTLDKSTIRTKRMDEAPRTSMAALTTVRSAGQIINTALKLWKIIEDNRPVVNVNTQYATALPKGPKHWTDMGGWKSPKGAVYELTAKNLAGIEVVHVRYQVLRTYGGRYRGKGQYLTAVTVQPTVKVDWGYHFDMDASIPDPGIVNVGTPADPVAGMTVELAWRVSTCLMDSRGKGLYFVRGDGTFTDVGAGSD